MSSVSTKHPEMPEVSTMETERLILRRLCSADAEHMLRILSNPEASEWLDPSFLLTTLQEAQAFIDERLARPGFDSFLAELRPTKDHAMTHGREDATQPFREVIGIVGCSSIASIGYIFHPKYAGKGYATEALKAYMESYWDRVPPVSSGKPGSCDYARAATDVDNLPSRKLLERCGFVLKYIREKNYNIPGKGGLRDDAFYMIARPGMDVDQVHIPEANH